MCFGVGNLCIENGHCQDNGVGDLEKRKQHFGERLLLVIMG